ncbi:hypothetical protein EDEG_03658 [Edhazardia aedis USNM 41457]|uniref:Structural maintenance of chromosomes protein 5 n=1 Tax=Edhazardia aedis (strain USNM 41457) TaxID=1003232 RepID=J9D2Q0_EDHAE|nr:hypothetical protein EDEG_03658 [Edhazardia aedis USNM 41457]|eukprot:EJW01859.1 hypothetical protein EDEG_03658 [Edhazardia aedis USNM 41457]
MAKHYLKSLNLTNFQTYAQASFTFHPNLNFICAPNGSGKSTIANALCFLCLGNPKNLSRNVDLGGYIKFGSDYFIIEGVFYVGRNVSIKRIVSLKNKDVDNCVDVVSSYEESSETGIESLGFNSRDKIDAKIKVNSNGRNVKAYIDETDSRPKSIKEIKRSRSRSINNDSDDIVLTQTIKNVKINTHEQNEMDGKMDNIPLSSKTINRSKRNAALINKESTRTSTTSQYFINNEKVTREELKKFYKEYNIDVSSLTQFLPQERVSDFVKMSGEEIFNAIFNVEDMHKDEIESILKLENGHADLSSNLMQLNSECAVFEKQVIHLKEVVDKVMLKNEKEKRIRFMQMKIKYLDYDICMRRESMLKEEIKAYQIRFKNLNERIEGINSQIESIDVSENKRLIKHMEKNINAFTLSNDILQESVNKICGFNKNLNDLSIDLNHLLKRKEALAEDLQNTKEMKNDLSRRIRSHKEINITESIIKLCDSFIKEIKKVKKDDLEYYNPIENKIKNYAKYLKGTNSDSKKGSNISHNESNISLCNDNRSNSKSDDNRTISNECVDNSNINKDDIESNTSNIIDSNNRYNKRSSKKFKSNIVEEKYSNEDIQKHIKSLIEEIVNKKYREKQELKRSEHNLKEKSYEIKRKYDKLEEQRQKDNQRMGKLRQFSRDTYDAVCWLRNNKSKFKEKIFEPSFLSINITDFLVEVETMLSLNALTSFICINDDDFSLLAKILKDQMKLSVNIFLLNKNDYANDFNKNKNRSDSNDSSMKANNCNSNAIGINNNSRNSIVDEEINKSTGDDRLPRPLIDREIIKKENLDGYIIDFISAPIEHKLVLCLLTNLHNVPVTKKNVDEQMLFRRYNFKKLIANNRYFELKRSRYNTNDFVTIDSEIKPRNLFELVSENATESLEMLNEERRELSEKLKEILDNLNKIDAEINNLFELKTSSGKIYSELKENKERKVAMENKLLNLESKIKDFEDKIKNNKKITEIESNKQRILRDLKNYIDNLEDFFDSGVSIKDLLKSKTLDFNYYLNINGNDNNLNSNSQLVLNSLNEEDDEYEDNGNETINKHHSQPTNNINGSVQNYINNTDNNIISINSISNNVIRNVNNMNNKNKYYLYEIIQKIYSYEKENKEKIKRKEDLINTKRLLNEDLHLCETEMNKFQEECIESKIEKKKLKAEIRSLDKSIEKYYKEDVKNMNLNNFVKNSITEKDDISDEIEEKNNYFVKNVDEDLFIIRKPKNKSIQSNISMNSNIEFNNIDPNIQLNSNNKEFDNINDSTKQLSKKIKNSNDSNKNNNINSIDKINISLVSYDQYKKDYLENLPTLKPQLETEINREELELQYIKTDSKSIDEYNTKNKKLKNIKTEKNTLTDEMNSLREQLISMKNSLAKKVKNTIDSIDKIFNNFF